MIALPDTKSCTHCQQSKPLDEYYVRGSGEFGRRSVCKKCQYAKKQARIGKPPKKVALSGDEKYVRMIDRSMKARYGVGIDWYNATLDAQGGGCAICGKPEQSHRRHHIDHCHATGNVRGILCHKCNLDLAPLEDSTWRVAAEKYLSDRNA